MAAHEHPRHVNMLLVVKLIGGQSSVDETLEELVLFHDSLGIMTDMQRAEETVESVMAWIRKTGSPKVRSGMARYGLPTENAVGIPVGMMRAEAKRIGPNHALALGLWKTSNFEAQLMAAMLGEPDRLTPAQMDAWCRDFDNWGTVDTACFTLFDRSPHGWKMARKWSKEKGEFQKRAGFVMMACLAAHDKTAKDAAFLKFLPIIEKGASDDRNFVKKGVSWALRHLGHRNAVLHAAAVKTATKLSKSDHPTERWVGKDALRDITRPAILGKVRRKKVPAKAPARR
jgi:3-methyladenine DNA glycosylase AlkD